MGRAKKIEMAARAVQLHYGLATVDTALGRCIRDLQEALDAPIEPPIPASLRGELIEFLHGIFDCGMDAKDRKIALQLAAQLEALDADPVAEARDVPLWEQIQGAFLDRRYAPPPVGLRDALVGIALRYAEAAQKGGE